MPGDEYVLTFPDGRKVGVGELTEWLTAVKADPTLSAEEIELAEVIVQGIRARLN